jgi:hypothetical protein
VIFFLQLNFFEFLVNKNLDLDPYPDSPKSLASNLDSVNNPDPKHWGLWRVVTYLFFVGQILSVCDQSSQQFGHAQPVKHHTARVNLKIWRKILKKNAYCHHLLKTEN